MGLTFFWSSAAQPVPVHVEQRLRAVLKHVPVLNIIRNDIEIKGRPGIDQHDPLAVENNTPGGRNIQDPDTVVFRKFLKYGPLAIWRYQKRPARPKKMARITKAAIKNCLCRSAGSSFWIRVKRRHQLKEGFFPKKALKIESKGMLTTMVIKAWTRIKKDRCLEKSRPRERL